MKRKGILTVICIAAVLLILCGSYVFTERKNVEIKMWRYLSEKGYSQTEIESMDVSHSFSNIVLSYNEWSIAVVYADEPTSVYYYHMKDGNIIEGGVSGTANKDELKH